MFMIRKIIILFLAITSTSFASQTDFLSDQKKYERVRMAYRDKGQLVLQTLLKENIRLDDLNMLIVAYKYEKQLDVYAKNRNEIKYRKVFSYEICAGSGQPGPKRKQGDHQVPEGFYQIDAFNPSSNYYLSLGINYPNKADRMKSTAANPGGDIFIHGACVTIGCLPMTNEKIEEIYICAIQARESGQLKIPVYIFPFKPTDENMKKSGSDYQDNPDLLSFWSNLKTGYDKFQSNMQELKVSVDEHGNYLFGK